MTKGEALTLLERSIDTTKMLLGMVDEYAALLKRTQEQRDMAIARAEELAALGNQIVNQRRVPQPLRVRYRND